MGLIQFVGEASIYLSLIGIFIYHLSRRKVLEKTPQLSGKKFIRFYSESQILFHWISFVVLAAAGATGYFILFTNNFIPLPFHEFTLFPLISLLAYHVVKDSGNLKSISLNFSDFSKIKVHKSLGRYHPLKKAYHLTISLAIVTLGITGFLLWNPFKITFLFQYFQDILILHLMSTLLLTSLGMFHIYLSLMPSNRPLLIAMITGYLDEQYYKENYVEQNLIRSVSKGVDRSRRAFIKSLGASILTLGIIAILSRGNGTGSNVSRPQTSSLQAQSPYGPIANSNQMSPNTAKTFYLPNGSPGILVKLSNGQLKAYSAVCTHQGCTVGYVPGQQIFLCPCHGAEFAASNGDVLRGPATLPLPQYPISVDSSGNVFVNLSNSSNSGNVNNYGGYGDSEIGDD
ncbi:MULTISPECIES: cytochrome b/b6 domain-containing protein [Metallosphaera]|uniref:Rieske (2Fe-2S) domain-containing protein n=1 Tax=Metallosphaera cuprina (strain Ar-4) TaxID=1006006 RepID=F4G2R7_METCR|nr:cytochrome b/b6 domain-containing protein [Metallosphaera cuprina]AEB95115.1 Rieske (2Fe-2S) domain-containing protein [Metallosphaera cuprina Ar-4]